LFLFHFYFFFLLNFIKSKGNNNGGDTISIVNKINATIDSDYSVERMAAVLGAATQSKLLTKRGKSKFRMR